MIKNLTKEEIRYKKFFKRVLCIDEVNVFSYFGEIFICGVIIPEKAEIPVNDSKKLNDNKIERISKILKNNLEYYIDKVSVKECNKNYLLGEYKAVIRLIKKSNPNAVIIDYHTIPNLCRNVKRNIWQIGYYKADEKLWSVASASIIAKSEFNEYWNDFIKKYPEYNTTDKGTLIRRCIEPIIIYGYLPDYHRFNWIKSALKTIKWNIELKERR